MSLERGVHAPVEPLELARILAEQMRPELGEPGAHALGVGRQVERPERTDLAVADEARRRSRRATTVLSKTATDLPPDQL